VPALGIFTDLDPEHESSLPVDPQLVDAADYDRDRVLGAVVDGSSCW
jgi:hypothetical protein